MAVAAFHGPLNLMSLVVALPPLLALFASSIFHATKIVFSWCFGKDWKG